MSATFFIRRREAARKAKAEEEARKAAEAAAETPQPAAETTVGRLDEKDLLKYKKADLQELARKLGVSDVGTVQELAARCASVEVEVPAE